MTPNVFLQAVILDADDVWNGDGRGAERTKAMLDAIRDLPSVTTHDQAHELYWRIDNVAVIQGGLFPAGPKILPALLDGLFNANEISRPYLLDAIYEIAGGGMSEQALSVHEPERLASDMIRTVKGAMRYFMHLAVRGSDAEALTALDLISLIISAPERLPITMANYDQDLHILDGALSTLHVQRAEHLSRNFSG